MPQIVPYDNKTDPTAFLMSIEVAIQSVGGDDHHDQEFRDGHQRHCAYLVHHLGRREDLVLETTSRADFGELPGNYDDPITFRHLFAVKQGINETLQIFVKCFVNVKCHASRLSEHTIITQGKRGSCTGRFTHGGRGVPPQTVSELMKKMEEYDRAEGDELRKRQQKHLREAFPHHEDRKLWDRELEHCLEREEAHRKKEIPRCPA